MLKAALTRGKLKRTEARIKKLHGLQKRNRRHIQELLRARDDMEREAYEEKKTKLEAVKHGLIEQIAPLEEDQRRLEGELRGLESAKKAKAKA
ncbi:MAG: hypothetical protein LC624_10210 [Halobacteriales archaeon]|nr:hypothetical protein [Halobacteriales archaeon]